MLSLIGCTNAQPSEKNAMLNEKLISIAKNQINKKRPEWSDKLKRTPQVIDKADYWIITFPLPQPKEDVIVTGGAPVVWIDKKTMEVTRLYHTQ